MIMGTNNWKRLDMGELSEKGHETVQQCPFKVQQRRFYSPRRFAKSEPFRTFFSKFSKN